MELPLNSILLGDCLDVLKGLPGDSVDSLVSDVPYGLGKKEPSVEEIISYLQGGRLDMKGDFMNNDWEIPSVATWKEVYRVLKPGALLFVFGGSRTFDLISLGLRAAGFTLRDSLADNFPEAAEGIKVLLEEYYTELTNLQWCYSSGMPKSTNVGKAIDKKLGKDRIQVGTPDTLPSQYTELPASDESAEHQGKGSGLKPAWEPILVFRKPFRGTLVDNVLKHGTGAYNIDSCRVKHASKADFEAHKKQVDQVRAKGGVRSNSWKNASDLSGANEVSTDGRWPANFLLTHAEGCERRGSKKVRNRSGSITGSEPSAKTSGVYGEFEGRREFKAHGEGGFEEVEDWDCAPGCPVAELDSQSGSVKSTLTGRADPTKSHGHPGTQLNPNSTFLGERTHLSRVYADEGGASKVFMKFEPDSPFIYCSKANRKEAGSGEFKVEHPTLKPLKLLRYLVRLGTPRGGTILDPYCGSGTTCHAALLEGYNYVGIERDPDNHAEAVRRLDIAKAKLEEEARKEREIQSSQEEFMLLLGGDSES